MAGLPASLGGAHRVPTARAPPRMKENDSLLAQLRRRLAAASRGEHTSVVGNVSIAAWKEGHLELMRDTTAALGDGLLI